MHSLLKRQMRRHHTTLDLLPPEICALLADVDAAYSSSDDDRVLLERSLELSGRELLRANAESRAELSAFPDRVLRLNRDSRILSERGTSSSSAPTAHPSSPAHARDMIEGDSLSRLSQAVHDALADQRVVRLGSVRLTVDLDHTYEVRLVPLSERDEVMAYFRDVTELTLAVENLRRSEGQLHQAQKMEAVGRLAGGIAHDFNNLLTVIIGQAQLLAMTGSLAAVDRERIEQVAQAGEQAAGLTRQLLMFSRRQDATPTIFSPSAVIASLEKMLRRLIGEHIVLITNLAPDCGYVRMDRGQLEQVLVNLAVNARDAMPLGGRITISASNGLGRSAPLAQDAFETQDRQVRIVVSDSGTGMPPEVMSHLFEPFFTTKGIGKGTGLGLATSHGIITGAGGKINVDSVPGHGSTFEILLPGFDGPAEALPDAEVAQPEMHDPATVLVVEDQGGVRVFVAEVLRSAGYAVLLACDGAAAMSLCSLHEGPIDLLLTDVMMPAIGGRELAHRLGKSRPEIPVLFMTGHTEEAERLPAICQRVQHILKPFSPSSLLRTVRNALLASRCVRDGGPSRDQCDGACPLARMTHEG